MRTGEMMAWLTPILRDEIKRGKWMSGDVPTQVTVYSVLTIYYKSPFPVLLTIKEAAPLSYCDFISSQIYLIIKIWE